MMKSVLRLFVIKSRLEAYAVIYALAVGATTRGFQFVGQYPGATGWLLFACCTGAVFMAGAKLLDATRPPAYRGNSLRRVLARARAG